MSKDPRWLVGLAVLVGVAGFTVGGIIAAIQNAGPSDATVASLSTLLAALGGVLVGKGSSGGGSE